MLRLIHDNSLEFRARGPGALHVDFLAALRHRLVAVGPVDSNSPAADTAHLPMAVWGTDPGTGLDQLKGRLPRRGGDILALAVDTAPRAPHKRVL